MDTMDKRQYEYMLRFSIEPGHFEEERLKNLLAFCHQSGTTDVMFFYNCEELNRGHLVPDELSKWLTMIARLKPILAAEGITTSINPWSTMLHLDRGRALRTGQDFALMMDSFGNRTSAVACPACERFLEYLAWQYRICAEIVHPNVLWVEDDFRLHNHDPLVWGGCFCDKHMDLYSQHAGKILTREEFAAGVLSPGTLHPYRKIWLDVALETMLNMAQTIKKAVVSIDPQIRIGLMSSDPVTHSAEGRDWDVIFNAFRTKKDPYIRIHLPAYHEITSQQFGINFALVSRLTRHMVPDWVENFGELENLPFSRFIKSQRFTQMELEINVLLDGKGITLDIFDMMGNGVLLDDKYQDVLAESKPFLDALVNIGFDNRCQAGIRVMIDPRSASRLYTEKGCSMTELYSHERNLMQILVPFGISTCYESIHDLRRKTLAISGQYLRALKEFEIRDMFARNFIILDGEAACTLLDLGLGDLAGINRAERITMNNGVNAYEQVVDGNLYCGISSARMTMQGAGDYIKLRYLPDISKHEFTHAFSPFGIDNGTAMTIVNEHIFILPYQNYSTTLLNPIRRAILLNALSKAVGFERPVWSNEPHVTVIQYDFPGRSLFALVNFSGDDYLNISLNIPSGVPSWNRATLYTRDCPKGIPAPIICSGELICIKKILPRIQMMILELVLSE